MTSTTHDHVLQVADLLDRPGVSRRVDLALPAPTGLVLDLAEAVAPLRLDGVLESVVDGVLVRGTLTTTIASACARCLRPLTVPVSTDVTELFAEPATRDGIDEAEVEPGYVIAYGAIDLDALLRDALVPAVPYRALCRSDCAGLCPQCGGDRNATPCDCATVETDTRWSALRDLRLPTEH